MTILVTHTKLHCEIFKNETAGPSLVAKRLVETAAHAHCCTSGKGVIKGTKWAEPSQSYLVKSLVKADQ